MQIGRGFLRLAFRSARFKRLYEPVQLGGRTYEGKRDSEARWQSIAAVIASHHARSVLDIGCSEGWFLRRAAAEFGCFAIGIDANLRRVLTGEVARLHDGVERVAVMKAMLEPEDIRGLPRCDVVLCLSVAHHVLRRGGLPAAEAFLAAIVTRAEKAVLFEMGTSDEAELTWSSALPAMEEGQEAFVRRLLGGVGLVNIRVVGRTPGVRKDADRLLFAGEPAGA